MSPSRQEMLQEMDQVWSSFHQHLDGLAYSADWRAEPEQWSVRDVITHLIGSPEHNLIARIRRALEEGRPEITPLSRDPFRTPQNQSMRYPELLEELERLYKDARRIVSTSTEEQLSRKALYHHPILEGERTVLDVAWYTFNNHWRSHIKQLAEIRDTLGLFQVPG